MFPRSHWLVVAIFALVACREPPVRAERVLVAQLSGCADLVRGPVCELDETREVRVVLPLHGHEQASFSSDRGPVRVLARHAVEGGRRFVVAVPRGASVLSARVRAVTYEASWSHAVADAPPRPWLEQAEARRKAGDVEAAASLVRAHLEAAEERAFALGVLGRVALRSGDLALGSGQLREAASLHESAGQSSAAASDRFALAFFLTEALHLEEADRVLRDAERVVAPATDDAASLAFYRGQLARSLGDFETALDLLEESERSAERAGDLVQAEVSLWERLRILYLLGDSATLEQLHRRLASQPFAALDGCDALTLQVSHAYARNTLARDLADDAARRGQARTTTAMLAPAAGQGTTRCPDRRVVHNVLIELAHAQLLAGTLDEAEATLARARGALDEPALHELLLEYQALRGRIALERGDDALAVATFTEMEAASKGERWLEPRARALAHRGLAEARSGRSTAALATYARMEDALDALTARAPLGADRAAVSASLEAYSEAHARLLRERDPAAALALALRSRARRSRMLQARARLAGLPEAQRGTWSRAVASLLRARREAEALEASAWQLPAQERRALEQERERLEHDALRAIDGALGSLVGAAPAPDLALADDEMLVVFLAGSEDAVALIRQGSLTTARTLPAASHDAEATARAWIGALSDALDGVKRLVLVPAAAQLEVDWHALPVRGGPLSAQLDVVYSQGRPAGSRYRVPAHAPLLVMADPTGDLPEARAEAAWITREGSHTWPVTSLVAGAATPERARRDLPRHELFHFAGHTRFDAGAPWRVSLVLADDARFGLVDALGLSRAPGLVVLSSCESARASAGSAVGAAFLAAGARVVIAPARGVADALSRRFAEAFYRALADGRDPVRAAHLAQAQLRSAGEPDWAAFRVLVP
jgi:hypothetical protein